MMKSGVLLAGMVAAAVAIVFCAGCESEKTTTGITLTVSPETVAFVISNNVQIVSLFKAEGVTSNQVVYFPLVWTVSDQRLGIIRDATGYTAVYETRNAEGVNTVTVRDQAGAEGIALISQEIR